jgi:hypothetical protein
VAHLFGPGFQVRLGAALHGFAERLFGVVHPEGYGLYAVAVLVDVAADLGAAVQGRGEHQADLALLHHVRFAVFETRSQAGVGQRLEAECGFVEVGGLLGVAHVKFNVIGTVQGQKVFGLGNDFF